MATFYPTTNPCMPVKVLTWSGSGTSTRVATYTSIPGFTAKTYYFKVFEEEDMVATFGPIISGGQTNSITIGRVAKDSVSQKYYVYDTETYSTNFEKLKNFLGKSSLFHAMLDGNGSSAGVAESTMDLIQNWLNEHFGCPIESDYGNIDAGLNRYCLDTVTNIGSYYWGNLRSSASGNWFTWRLPVVIHSSSGVNTIRELNVTFSPDNYPSNNYVRAYINTTGNWNAYPAITYDPYTPPSPSNPYPNIPNSDTSGGGGSGTDTSDSNPVPLLPSVSAIGTGMCRLYNPTVAQLIDLGAWLWGSGLDLTQLKKIFSDPMDVILGCSVFPVSMPTETTPQTIIFGNIDSQISSRVVSSQYTSYDLGQIDVTSYYNSYLDFAPYTKMQIYLPFIGMKSINVDEFMSTASVIKRIGVTYSIDLLSGACVAHVYLNVGSTSTLLYEFGGTCNTQIPLNSRDYTATVQSLLGIVGGSAAAGVAAFMLPEAIPAVVGAAGVVGGMVMNAAKNTVASKPTVEHAGGIGGSTGIMGSRKAYLIIERPNLCHPENQEHFTGYPGFLYRTVNQLDGYTKFINFELQNIHATEPELEEIKEWFTVKGVLL